MAIHVIQSQRIEVLLDRMLAVTHQQKQSPLQVLQPQHFIVPSAAIETWLMQKIAEKKGISANTVFHHRIRAFQWKAYQAILEDKDRVRQANIPRLMIKWRVFQALQNSIYQTENPFRENHPLYTVMQRIYDSAERIQNPEQQRLKKQSMLYWLSEQISRLFTNYMEYRGYCAKQHEQGQKCDCPTNWLDQWGSGQNLDFDRLYFGNNKPQLMTEADEYKKHQIQQLEAWQRWLWQKEFHQDYVEMQKIDAAFWQILDDEEQRAQVLKYLPDTLVVFTLLELPPAQLTFLRRLGQYINIILLHYNPSQEYWADSVDPKWKQTYDLKLRDRFKQKYPDKTDKEIDEHFENYERDFNAEFRDSRHPLLTRFGKQARDHFSLLSVLSSGEEGEWDDRFDEDYPDHLLGKLQSDILNLLEPEPRGYHLQPEDDSIQIHVCHSSLRQLEVLKDQLIYWLSQGKDDAPRQPNDILVLSPNLKDLEPLIRSVFSPPPLDYQEQGQASQAQTSSVYLPVKIAGVTQLDVQNAWRSMLGPIQLSAGRFTVEDFADWLNLTATQLRYEIDVEQSARILDLLTQAGFKRGLDQTHLQKDLAPDDQDYRFSFKFALDRLAMGLAVPEHAMVDGTLSFASVTTADFELVAKLIQIYQDFAQRRDWLHLHESGEARYAEDWLGLITQDIDAYLKAGVESLRSVREIVNKQLTMLTLTYYHEQRKEHQLNDIRLPLPYLLQEIQNNIEAQLEQAVPTGQITFSQIGQIRPLPYKLVVILNLDGGKFPSRNQHLPFDLMNSFRQQLGDRSRVEDDQGAFLDALLLAKDNLWMFYNGFDVNDGEVRDASSVLNELIQHLSLIVDGNGSMTALPKLATLAGGIEVPEHLQSLYRVHSLQPYDASNYLKTQTYQSIRYRDAWFAVANRLLKPQGHAESWASSQNQLLKNESNILDANQWINQLTFPASLYLQTLGVGNIRLDVDETRAEPLILDGLQKYAVRDFLYEQQTTALESDLLLDQLPVGKLKEATWNISLLERDALLERLKEYTIDQKPTETLTTQRLLQVGEYTLRITVPEQPTKVWASVTASSARGKRRGKIWLEYLLWLASLETEQTDYQRVVVCSDVTVICEGISPEDARVYLSRWMQAWEFGQTQALCLPAMLMLATADTKGKPYLVAEDVKEIDADTQKEIKVKRVLWTENEHGQWQLDQFDKLLKKWMDTGDFSAFDLRQDEASHLHLDWSYILRDCDARKALNDSCMAFGYVLYQPIYDHQRTE